MGAQVPRFLAVGALAYVLDVGIFLGLTEFVLLGVEPARVCSFVAITLFTYLLNGRLTFRACLSRMGLAKYVVVQLIGMLLNLGSFWLAIQSWADFHPLIALTLGSIVGSTFNFLAMRRYVFNDTHPVAG